MSSSYYALCVSHTPAITISADLGRADADHLTTRDRLGDHQQCDIVIGRYSGALVELGCPGTQLPGPSACRVHHRGIEWTRVEWLRLLAVAAPHVPASAHERITARGCWPLDRLARLSLELGLPAPDTTPED
jgi:hypothetical protein